MKLLMDFLSSSCNPYQWHLFQRLIYLRVYGIRPGTFTAAPLLIPACFTRESM